MNSPDPAAIPLLDLKAQYASIRDELDAALMRVVASQAFVLGPEVEAFEAEIADLLGVPHAIGCASGTDALLLPLRALREGDREGDREGAGDEVIVPAFTFFATAGAVWNAGLRPVFCDVDPDTFTLTPETVEAVWSERTRAVVPVHLFGQMAPMTGIRRIAAERGALVIEDAAQAIGARQRTETGELRAGGAGDVGALSFFPTKNLGGFGEGGMVTTHDDEIARRVRALRVHGGRQMYHHEWVGTNSRLDALQAAVLRVKLRHLEGWTERRRAHACRYHARLGDLAEVTLPAVGDGAWHVYHQFTIRTPRRDALRGFLADRGIGSGIYYPVPLHLQPSFREIGGRPGDHPVAEGLCREVLSLPIFPELGAERVDRVADAIHDFFAR
ncbi:MAG: DegT/DnrJ/EryC1/StrS family aminotransferase [Longimicrobiales bacterium]|nr:DegT/DnrJ/EryC1/StrS family aminotransferase [Longimicrobiales bacterium]